MNAGEREGGGHYSFEKMNISTHQLDRKNQ